MIRSHLLRYLKTDLEEFKKGNLHFLIYKSDIRMNKKMKGTDFQCVWQILWML